MLTSTIQSADSLTPSGCRSELLRLLEEKARRTARRKLESYRPYTKQAEFHASGASHRERLLMAGNQLGKSYAGAAEMAMHLTGFYPAWWRGKRFDRPVRMWAGSQTSEVTRDVAQRLLVGPAEQEEEWGTGFIPADKLRGWSRRQSSVANSLDTVRVKHASGGISTLGFKSYDQGRQKWQGPTLDGIWLDEEPPVDLYMEAITRTNVGAGPIWITFTPLLGMSDVVRMFIEECPL